MESSPASPRGGLLASDAVDPLDPLGYGTLLLIDGRRAGASRLADVEALHALLSVVAAELEPASSRLSMQVDEEDGASVALLLDEAQLSLHVFPALGAFTFRAFSRHALSDGELLERVLRELHAGRFESSLKRRAAPLPKQEAALRARLLGDRGYARARFDDGPLA